MGSRRSRRAQGRVLEKRPSKKAVLSITKAQKHANRLQQKSNVLTAARVAREASQSQAPILITLLPLTDISDARLRAIQSTLTAVPQDKSVGKFDTAIIRREGGNRREMLLNALDIAKVADILLLVFDGRSEIDDHAIDLIDAVCAQGLPSVHVFSVGDGSRDADLRKFRSRQLAAKSLGEDHALRPIPFDVDNGDDAAKTNQSAIRRLLSKSPHQLAWRARYGYMSVETAVADDLQNDSPASLKLCGWVRGRGFSANELLHLTGMGSFAINRIVDFATGTTLSIRDENIAEPVKSEGDVNELMGEQTWPPEIGDNDMLDDDAKIVKDNGEQLAIEYDAAVDRDNDEPNDDDKVVTIDDMDDDDDDGEDMDGGEGDDMTIDADEVQRVRDAAKNDLDFPDEVDTPLEQSARVRFARYRGLQSLRTGEWDPKEQLPREYASLFQFRNLVVTRKRVLAQAIKDEAEAASNPHANFACRGKRVYIELKDVSLSVRQAVVAKLAGDGSPVVASGMLRHENRRSVVNFAVKRLDSLPEDEVIKAKSHLEMHCGFVRFDGRPMFSENNANSDKHKMERFLPAERLIVASFYGPAVFAPAPALLCHVDGGIVATGRTMGANVDRIVLKRIILTGYPFKTQKKRTVAKFMFFSPDDVRWFKPVELWTKLGRSGHIMEPIGTHGHMKCQFDNVVMHHDTICMTLYKRVYPKLVTES